MPFRGLNGFLIPTPALMIFVKFKIIYLPNFMLSCNGELIGKAKLQKSRAEKELNIYISILRSKQLKHTKYTFMPYLEKFIETLRSPWAGTVINGTTLKHLARGGGGLGNC